jgi:hypothetical protein
MLLVASLKSPKITVRILPETNLSASRQAQRQLGRCVTHLIRANSQD